MFPTVARSCFRFQPQGLFPITSWCPSSRGLATQTDDDISKLDFDGLQSELTQARDRSVKIQDRLRSYRGADAGRRILVLGAGMSATSLIQYFLDNSVKENWTVYVGDADKELADRKIKGHPKAFGFKLDASNNEQLRTEIKQSDIVVSLLPATLHSQAQKHCLEIGRNLVTASYVSDYATSIHEDVKKKNLIFLNEVGLDPGIDHMISMKTINEIKAAKGNMSRFESFCGGLVSDEFVEGNPWKYKFTWNPRNVVLAGQGGCHFLQRGATKIIPYQSIFTRVERLHVPGYGEFEGLGNRDSLVYKDIYGLKEVGTLFRGTLRRPGYSEAWNAIIRLGLTNDKARLDCSSMTYRQFTNVFLPYRPSDSVELKVAYLLGISLDGEIFQKLKWMGLFDHELIGLDSATPAEVLQKLLEKKWSMKETDKDMIVMLNKFEYSSPDYPRVRELQSSMVLKGKDNEQTAMSMTVGLPAAICTKLILNGEIKRTGVIVPTTEDIYEPVLKELEGHGITFVNVETDFYGDE